MKKEFLVTWRRKRLGYHEDESKREWHTNNARRYYQTRDGARDLVVRLRCESPGESCWCSDSGFGEGADGRCALCQGEVKPAFDILLREREVGEWSDGREDSSSG